MKRSIASDLKLLLGGRVQRARGAVRSAGRAGWIRAALVVIGGALVSGLLVKRDVDRADLVTALKTRD